MEQSQMLAVEIQLEIKKKNKRFSIFHFITHYLITTTSQYPVSPYAHSFNFFFIELHSELYREMKRALMTM